MKRLILILLLIPSLVFGAFTEFYMTSGGSNLNSGSTSSNSATYTSAGGNWVNATHVFTPTDGSNPSSTVNVGDFASVYITSGATNAVYIGRINAVQNATNGTITCNTSGSNEYGAAPANGTGTMTIKVGGAWSGPTGTTNFPFGLSGSLASLLNTNGNHTRVNVKNDQTYSMTATLPFASLGASVLEGYSTTAGDGGKATFTSNSTSGSNFTNASGTNAAFIDLFIANTGSSGTNDLFGNSAATTFLRCVFHGARGSGLVTVSLAVVIESEAYDCNKSNTAGKGGFSTSGSSSILICYDTYSHDHAAGSNADGYASVSTSGGMFLFKSTSDTVAGSGAHYTGGSQGLVSIGGNYYNNTGDAIKFDEANPQMFSVLMNNNFIKNGGKGINNTVTAQSGIIYNNGRGSGTQANGSSDTLGSILDTSTDITYASGVTPWTAPTTGNFSIVPGTAAVGAGREVYTETDGTNTGTVGFPDIGTAQAPTPTATATFTPTPTATATASFTPCAPTPGPTATSTPTPTPTATSTSTPTPTPSPTAPIEMSYGFQG